MPSSSPNTQLLQNEFGQIESYSLSNDQNNALEGIQITHQYCTASVSLYAGHVLSWKPEGQHPIFWLSESADYKIGKAIRGGIPLCWPWFGAHHKDAANTQGNHGFARQSQWQVASLDISSACVTLVLTLQGVNQHPLFPIAYELIQTLSFGKEFTQQLEMKNNSDVAIEYTAALHSYFRVSHPENVRIDGLSALHYDDKLTGEHNVKQPLLNGVGPVDRVYFRESSTDNKMTIVDKQWRRSIDLTSSNTAQWVFWNPGKALAEKMADVHHKGENEYVCLEAANTEPNFLQAQSTVIIGQRITVNLW